MPRPERDRTIFGDFAEGLFGPRGRPFPGSEEVELTLDGLEALRLVDLEGLYQEAAAERMGVSRPTLARILTQARHAVTDALVHRKTLVVGGGAVRRAESGSEEWPCPVHGQRRRRGRGCRCDGTGPHGRRRRAGREPQGGSA